MKNKDKSVKAVIAHLHKQSDESADGITKPKKVTKTRYSNWEEAVADRLREWALNPASFQIEEFYSNEMLPTRTFYDGVARNEKLNQAHEFALLRCGINREKLAIRGRENMNTTNSAMLYHYLDRWSKHKKDDQEREDIKAKGIKEALGNITIIDHMLEKE